MFTLAIAITAEDEGKPVRLIAMQRLSMSYGQFKRAKFQGELLLDGERVHADRRVKAGQTFIVRVPDPETGAIKPWPLPLTVAYEDEDILVVDKPAPLASVHSSKQDGPTLENAVFSYLGEPEGFVYRPVNRLDKGTSGLMAVAKHAHAQQFLQRRLHTGAFLREYLAVCDGVPPECEGVIEAPIIKADGATIRRMICERGKPARTAYCVERTCGGHACNEHDCDDRIRGARSLLRLRLHTGRTHQIRVHLSSLGCPVTGDFLYGTEHPLLKRRFALHSACLELTTVNEKHIRLISTPPDVFTKLLSNTTSNP
jgi:23S rRNA pseudouridine1911/1915/1917 synthase